ncbi:MAG: hypothetical protein RIS64_938 [Bacteroidota bacterium]|jgi:hypothetical protein
MLLLNQQKVALIAAFLHASNGFIIELSMRRDATNRIDLEI